MADLTAVYAALQKADAAGDTAGAKQLADYLRQQKPTQTPDIPANPATDFGGDTLQFGPWNTHIPIGQDVQNYLAGAGKATADFGRGAGQWLGLTSRQDVADARQRDAPLMHTKAGLAGDITGTVADLLPAAFIPGAGTLAGAAGIGAGTGLLQPSTSTGETALNTGLGAVAGPAGVLLGRGVGALYQGAKAALEPLFRGGQDRIAARTLQSFAGGAQPAQQAAQNLARPPQVLPGVQPTTAELANNAGIAQLERTLKNNPEAMTALNTRMQSNRTAMTGALDQIAGTPADMAQSLRTRSQLASPLYDSAQQAVVPADADLGKLLTRPSMTKAWERAQALASESGETLGELHSNDISGKTLQYLKMGLNDLISGGPQSGMGSHELNAVKSTLASFNKWTMKNVPQLRAADRSFQDLSRPINQMEVGGALRDKLVPALGDFGNNTRLSAQNYANAVRNGDALAANATGLPNAQLSSVLNPSQMQRVNQVGEQLARRANADELGRATGSNTGQNLASQNVLRQFLGPLGLPQSVGERAAQSTLGQTILRPLQFAAQAGEPRILQHLANATLNPQEAARLLQLAQHNPRIAQLLWARQGLLGPISNTAGMGLMGSGNAAQQ